MFNKFEPPLMRYIHTMRCHNTFAIPLTNSSNCDRIRTMIYSIGAYILLIHILMYIYFAYFLIPHAITIFTHLCARPCPLEIVSLLRRFLRGKITHQQHGGGCGLYTKLYTRVL